MALLITKRGLSLEAARQIVGAIEAEARKQSLTPSIAVVDEGGNTILVVRMDGAELGTPAIALDKARTALLYRRPSKELEDFVSAGKLGFLAVPGAIPTEGGVPVIVDGEIVGAVGVSGAKSAVRDGQLAAVGTAALG
jgi:glc operon protein GlcG